MNEFKFGFMVAVCICLGVMVGILLSIKGILQQILEKL